MWKMDDVHIKQENLIELKTSNRMDLLDFGRNVPAV